jgi:hypothetical protein
VVAAKAGATNRHMFWSHPKPWANIIGRPSTTPPRVTLFRTTAFTTEKGIADIWTARTTRGP